MAIRGFILVSFGEVRIYHPAEKIGKVNGKSVIVENGTYHAITGGVTHETAANSARKIAGGSLDGTVYRATGNPITAEGFIIVGEFHDPEQPTIPAVTAPTKDVPAKDVPKK